MEEKKEIEASKVSKKPVPSVLSINICDTIMRDETTKKVSLIGLFNTIKANTFPCKHPTMHVYIAVTNGHGKYKIDIRFSCLEDQKIIAGINGELDFQNPLQVIELNLCWQGLSFDKAGEYVVDVFCDDSQIGTRKFRVIGPEQKMLPTDGTEAR